MKVHDFNWFGVLVDGSLVGGCGGRNPRMAKKAARKVAAKLLFGGQTIVVIQWGIGYVADEYGHAPVYSAGEMYVYGLDNKQTEAIAPAGRS